MEQWILQQSTEHLQEMEGQLSLWQERFFQDGIQEAEWGCEDLQFEIHQELYVREYLSSLTLPDLIVSIKKAEREIRSQKQQIEDGSHTFNTQALIELGEGSLASLYDELLRRRGLK